MSILNISRKTEEVVSKEKIIHEREKKLSSVEVVPLGVFKCNVLEISRWLQIFPHVVGFYGI